jgi:hypothetical protein
VEWELAAPFAVGIEGSAGGGDFLAEFGAKKIFDTAADGSGCGPAGEAFRAAIPESDAAAEFADDDDFGGVVEEFADAAFGLFTGAEIDQRADHARGPAGGVAEDLAAVEHIGVGAIGVAEAILVGAGLAVVGEGGEEVGFDAWLGFRVDAPDSGGEGGATRGFRVPVEGGKGVAPPELVRGEVEVPDGVVGGVGDALEAFVGFADGGFVAAQDRGEVAGGAVGIFMGDDDLGDGNFATVAGEEVGLAGPGAVSDGFFHGFVQKKIVGRGAVKIADAK